MKVAYLFTAFPVASQTFLQREIRGVAATGIEVDVHSMWTPQGLPEWKETPGVTVHPWGKSDLFADPFGSLIELVRPRAATLLPRAARVVAKYPPRSTEDVANAALAGAFALRHAAAFRLAGYDLIHGAWATAPATAALLLSRLCGVPFSFGAHAYDVHRNGGDRFLRYKLEKATLIHTTTEMNVAHLSGLVPAARDKIVLARRGLPALPPLEPPRPLGDPVRLLSVGRLVAKKGQDRQIEAVRLLRASGMACALRIVGDGPLRSDLERQIARLSLEKEVTLLGALPQDRVVEEYRRADFFIHSGIVDTEGDRDGLPNVVPEAMAHGVPVVSSDTAGVVEAVQHGRTGWIAPHAAPEALAEGIRRLAGDDALRERTRQGAHAWVAENFLVENNARRLAEAFRSAVDAAST